MRCAHLLSDSGIHSVSTAGSCPSWNRPTTAFLLAASREGTTVPVWVCMPLVTSSQSHGPDVCGGKERLATIDTFSYISPDGSTNQIGEHSFIFCMGHMLSIDSNKNRKQLEQVPTTSVASYPGSFRLILLLFCYALRWLCIHMILFLNLIGAAGIRAPEVNGLNPPMLPGSFFLRAGKRK